TICGGGVVVRVGEGGVVERATTVGQSAFPYVPGLLSFREAPSVLEAFAKLKTRPDALMLDGQGLAHPRRFGLACHVGLWLDRPCLGVAKSRFRGLFGKLGEGAGSTTDLVEQGTVVGRVVRTRIRVKPVFVSAGHKIDLESA